MNIPREFDLSSLQSSSEPLREFVIDPDAQVIFPRPRPTGAYGVWIHFVAWFCRGNIEREAYAIRNGYLPLKFNGAQGIDVRYLLDGLRSSLCDLPGFDAEVFEAEATRLRNGLGAPHKSPVALAKKLVERTRGISCAMDTMEAIRTLVTQWLEGPQAKALNFNRAHKETLIRLACFSTNSEHLSGLDVALGNMAQYALEAAISVVTEQRNKKTPHACTPEAHPPRNTHLHA